MSSCHMSPHESEGRILFAHTACLCATVVTGSLNKHGLCDPNPIDSHKNGTEAPFYDVCFSIGCDRPLNFLKKILRIFTTETSFLSLGRDTITAV